MGVTMTLRLRQLLLSLSVVLMLAACGKEEAAAPVEEAPAPLVAPTDGDDTAWRNYLIAVVQANLGGINNSPFMYYLPAPGAEGWEDSYARQAAAVGETVERTVLPGNMLAFGSPDSAKMADLIVEAFAKAGPNSLPEVRVLFIGKAEDRERVAAAVTPSGAEFVFHEAR
jgi:hypothetical protein